MTKEFSKIIKEVKDSEEFKKLNDRVIESTKKVNDAKEKKE